MPRRTKPPIPADVTGIVREVIEAVVDTVGNFDGVHTRDLSLVLMSLGLSADQSYTLLVHLIREHRLELRNGYYYKVA